MIEALAQADHGIEVVNLDCALQPRQCVALAAAVGHGKCTNEIILCLYHAYGQANSDAFGSALQEGGSLKKLKVEYIWQRFKIDATYLVSALGHRCPQLESLILEGAQLRRCAVADMARLSRLRHLEL